MQCVFVYLFRLRGVQVESSSADPEQACRSFRLKCPSLPQTTMSDSSTVEFTVTQADTSRTFSRKTLPDWSSLQADLTERFHADADQLRLAYLSLEGEEVTVGAPDEWELAWEAVKDHYSRSGGPLQFTLVGNVATTETLAPEEKPAPVTCDDAEFTPRIKNEKEDNNADQGVPSAFIPTTESEELRAATEADSSISDDRAIEREANKSPSDSGSDTAIVIVSKEEASAAEADWEREHPESAKASPAFEVGARFQAVLPLCQTHSSFSRRIRGKDSSRRDCNLHRRLDDS